MNDLNNLVGETNAQVWASEFVTYFKDRSVGEGIDEDLMTTWFANAIEAGREAGDEKGYQEGRADGYDEGYEDGRVGSYDEGYGEGWYEGREEIRQQIEGVL